MSQAITIIQDRETIDDEIVNAIRSYEYYEKQKLASIYYYLYQKKQLDSELEKELQKKQKYYETEALKIQKEINQIILGDREPNEEELENIDEYLNEEDLLKKAEINKFLNKDPLLDYWYKALKQCPMIKNEIKERDEAVLKNLSKIEYSQIPETLNFTLTFYFQHNDYFTNFSLYKTFFMKGEDQPIKTESLPIDWKEGKNVTKKTVKKHQKNKRTGAKRTITKEVDDESFFNFFKNVSLDEEEGIEKLSEEENAKILEKMNIDYDLARAIIDELLPYSLEYYLGVRVMNEDLISKDENEQDQDEDDDKHTKKKKKNEIQEKQQEKPLEKADCHQQ